MVEFLIKDLFCIFSSNFVGICHPLISIGLCHLCTGIALITFHILIQCLLFLSAILSDTKPRAKHLFNVYLISRINKDYWLITTVDATRWRKIATIKKKILATQILCGNKLKFPRTKCNLSSLATSATSLPRVRGRRQRRSGKSE